MTAQVRPALVLSVLAMTACDRTSPEVTTWYDLRRTGGLNIPQPTFSWTADTVYYDTLMVRRQQGQLVFEHRRLAWLPGAAGQRDQVFVRTR